MMKTSLTLTLLLGNFLLFLQGVCEETESIDSMAIWKSNCMKCHAADGSGSTPIGKKFGARDYTDPAVQASFTDEEIVQITKEGVVGDKGKGHRKRMQKRMPGYSNKLTDEEIQALVPLIRSFAKE